MELSSNVDNKHLPQSPVDRTNAVQQVDVATVSPNVQHQHRVREPASHSPPFANDVQHQPPTNSPQHRHLQMSKSVPSPTRVSPIVQPTRSPHDVDRTAQAVGGTSPNQMIFGTSAPSHSTPVQHPSPIQPVVSPDEQRGRPSSNRQHMPASQQYSQPAGNYDRYGHRGPSAVSRELSPYHQQIPAGYRAAQPRLGSPNAGGVHQKRDAIRSSSYQEQQRTRMADSKALYKNGPIAPGHRSSPQREIPASGNERGHSGERMLSFDGGPSPRQQNILMSDPYRLHRPPVDETNYLQHDRVGSGLDLGREYDFSVNNRPRTHGHANANNGTAGKPAFRRLSPPVRGPSQYSVPAYGGQQSNELYRYPSPSHLVNPRPLPPAQQPHNLRNPLAESQHFHNKQVCTESIV